MLKVDTKLPDRELIKSKLFVINEIDRLGSIAELIELGNTEASIKDSLKKIKNIAEDIVDEINKCCG